MTSLLQQKINNYDSTQSCNQIRVLLNKKEFQKISHIINTDTNINLKNLDNFGMNHLMIEYFLAINDSENFSILFHSLIEKGMIKKRNILIYINHLLSSNKVINAFSIFEDLLIGKFPITSSDLELICYYSHGRRLLTNYKKSLIKINIPTNLETSQVIQNTCSNCNHLLTKIEFDKIEQSKIMSLLENLIGQEYYKKTVTSLNNIKYKTVIDGANLLYYGQGNINKYSYQKIILMLDFLNDTNVLLILHKRHFRNEMVRKYGDLIEQIKRKCSIFETPYNQNDDWYIILASIMNNADIVTNDKFRDHDFKLKSSDKTDLILQKSFIIQMVDDLTYNYQIDSYKNILLEDKKYYSNRIQYIGGRWHIPCSDGSFICLKN